MTSSEAGPPYGTAGPQPYGSAAPNRARSGLAITAFVLALVAALVTIGTYVTQMITMVASMESVQVWAVINLVTNIGAAVIALAALIVGIFAVRGSRRALAGAAVGISAVHLGNTVLTVLVTVVTL